MFFLKIQNGSIGTTDSNSSFSTNSANCGISQATSNLNNMHNMHCELQEKIVEPTSNNFVKKLQKFKF